jgi:hypothetical protein
MAYPKLKVNSAKQTKTVKNAAEEAALGPDWVDQDEYPKAKYHREKFPVTVYDAAGEKALGPGWYDHPRDAGEGKELTNVERGKDPHDKVEVFTSQAAAEKAAADKKAAEDKAKVPSIP